jgi:glycerol-3-phosphate cytidylyltransferase
MEQGGRVFTDWQVAKEARAHLDTTGARIVFTNGVFDLLHVGHLRYLWAARALADQLWVGVNSDQSVRALKGEGRPITPWEERAELLAALRPVDAVIYFDAPTADEVLRLVRPALYVKGGDYAVETLPEAATAREIGCELRFLPLVAGHATSHIVEEVLLRRERGQL